MYLPISTRVAAAYRRVDLETKVSTADAHHLISLLYEGLLDAIRDARAALESGNLIRKRDAIDHAVRILEEGLKSSLDGRTAPEMARSLSDLYDCLIARLTTANLRNESAYLDEAMRLLVPVMDAWKSMPAQSTAPAGLHS